MSKAFEHLEELLEKTMALQTALILFEWDNETLAPKDGGSLTARVVGALSGEYHEVMTGGEMRQAIEACKKEGGLNEVQSGILREAAEELEEISSIPAGEYRDFAQLVPVSVRDWQEAKESGDFDRFAPSLKKVVDYQRKFASYRAKEGQKLYDVLLDTYEKGFDMENLDEFFGELKAELVPLLKEITSQGKAIDSDFLTGDYPVEKQEELARFMAEYLGFDFGRGVMAVSAHPFTTALHNSDVRLTTHYSDRVDSSLFSIIHETGHGLYEQGIGEDLTQTLLGQGASMGMHESQSRFFENVIGRSPAFWKPVYNKLVELFPDRLGNVPAERFVEAVNKVKPGLIRTEADELTYSLHIMVRYEIEKMLIGEELPVEKIPEIWAEKYEEYLGIRPENPSEGALQDIHWSQGSIGYFPSYALGSAFGAQIYYHMKKKMDFDGLLERGEIGVIREYLREHIHKFGKLKTSRQILKEITGEDFDPKYYIRYLKEKFSKVYGLS